MSSMLVLTRSATKTRRSWQVQRRSRRRASIKYHIGRGEGKCGCRATRRQVTPPSVTDRLLAGLEVPRLSINPRTMHAYVLIIKERTGSWRDELAANVSRPQHLSERTLRRRGCECHTRKERRSLNHLVGG